MKKYLYTAEQRQALNIVWNAAGRYDYNPPFVAYNPHGVPEFYLNFVVGLSDKWFDTEKLFDFFESYAGTAHQKVFDNITWLALENSLYEKELPHRPALKIMRENHALGFFREESTMSRQEWMAKNNLLYSLLSERWASVLGRKGPVLSPREKGLAKRLKAGGGLSTDGILDLMRAILKDYFLFSRFKGLPNALKFHFKGKLADLLARFASAEIVRTDTLEIRSSQGKPGGSSSGRNFSKRRKSESKNEMEACFGRSLYSPTEQAVLEHSLCTDGDSGRHLWFARGVPDSRSAKTPDAKAIAVNAEKQYQKNRSYYAAYSGRNSSTIRHLKAQITGALSQHAEPVPIASRSGRLSAGRVWRGTVLHSSCVFERRMTEPQPDFSVLLLLDASASRLESQEVIASQAYMISESLRLCRIPVEVDAFRSLRGFTVFQILKSYREGNSLGVFRYFSSGWNRDGLALKAAGVRLKASGTGSRILLVLTDASPNDAEPVSPYGSRPLPLDYSGSAGIEETAREVEALRSKDVQASAIFLGEDSEAKNAEKIYSGNFVRIHRSDEISKAVGKLLKDNISSLY
jgi:hypothetical protein